MGRRDFTEEDDEILINGWKAGLTLTQIANQFSPDHPRTCHTVWMRVRTLRRHGVEIERRRGDVTPLSLADKAARLADTEEKRRLKQKARERRERKLQEIMAARIAALAAAKDAADREANGCFAVKDMLIFTDNISPEEERDFGRLPFIGTHVETGTSASWGVK